jgi:hypothetical protein
LTPGLAGGTLQNGNFVRILGDPFNKGVISRPEDWMVHLCPHCQGPTKRLSVLSDISLADYYVCEICNHVLELPKGAIGTLQPLASEPELKAEAKRALTVL